MVSENEVNHGLVLALHRGTHATLHALGERLAELAVTAPEINVLATLAAGGAKSIRELAAGTATKPSTLTSALDRLVRRGWVRRDTDPGDRRSFLVSLTGAGRPAAEAAGEAMRDIERACRARTSDRDRAGFLAVIDALTEVSA